MVGKRKRSSSMYPSPPRTPRRRFTAPFSSGSPTTTLPRSAGAAAARRMSALRAGRSAIGGIARGAVKAMPYVDAAVMAYKGGKYVYNRFFKKTPRRLGSAANAKYIGKFKSGAKTVTNMDKFADQGVVKKMEYGKVVTESNRQVVYVAHSSMPAYHVGQLMFGALLKKLFMLAGHHIKNENEILLQDSYYNSLIRIHTKVKDGDVVSVDTFTVTANTSTLSTVLNAMQTWLVNKSETATLPNQFLALRLYTDFSGVISNAFELKAEIDLSTVSFDYFSNSLFKLQNRTINSTGNDQDNDVDNVPINGKSFEFKSNGTLYRDYGTPATGTSSAITTSNYYGVLPTTIPSATGTKMYDEVPIRTQFVGCGNVANVLLQPGEIKTSIIKDTLTISLSKLISVLYTRKPDSTGVGRFNQIWLGKTKLFAFEKLINAVAMSATNQFNLAYEHQLEMGCVCKIHKVNYTAPMIDQVADIVVT